MTTPHVMPPDDGIPVCGCGALGAVRIHPFGTIGVSESYTVTDPKTGIKTTKVGAANPTDTTGLWGYVCAGCGKRLCDAVVS